MRRIKDEALRQKVTERWVAAGRIEQLFAHRRHEAVRQTTTRGRCARHAGDHIRSVTRIGGQTAEGDGEPVPGFRLRPAIC